MSASRKVLAGALLFGCGLALAADEKLPDVEFLEYLGSWDESDEEWLMFEQQAVAEQVDKADEEKRSDPVPQGEESTETKDES